MELVGQRIVERSDWRMETLEHRHGDETVIFRKIPTSYSGAFTEINIWRNIPICGIAVRLGWETN